MILATVASELVQTPPFTVDEIVVVVPLHKVESNALTTPVFGAAVTLIVKLAVAFVPEQLATPATV